MNKLVLAAALAALGLPAHADSVEDRLATLEARLAQMEKRLLDQNRALSAKDARIAELEHRQADAAAPVATGGSGGWLDRIEVGGLVQIDANHVSPAQGDDTSDITAHKLELELGARVNDWVGAQMLVKYEEDSDNDGEVEIETLRLVVADPEAPWFVNAGQFVLPFGSYASYQLSDPITKELGETLDSAIEAGVAAGGFSASVYAFQGDRQDTVSNLGVSAGFEQDFEGGRLVAGLGYINDLAETNAIVDGGWVAGSDDKVGGWTASAQLDLGAFHLIAEYLAAMDEFDSAGGDRPRVYNLEAAYDFAALGRPAYLALGAQGARDAEDAHWALPETRLLGTVAVEVVQDTWLGLEYKRDKDFAGERESTLTGRLSVAF
jgi:hypothetical protein